MNEQEILDRGRLIRHFLQEQGGYWAFAPEEAMQIGPKPFSISNEEVVAAARHGHTVFDFWSQVAKILKLSIRGDLPEWIAESVEGPLSSKQRIWQRAVATTDGMPVFARMDCTSLFFPVEIQERLGFLGGCASWHLANDTVGYPKETRSLAVGDIPAALAAGFRSIANFRSPRILLISPTGYLKEQEFLRAALEKEGVSVIVADRDEFLNGIGVAIRNNIVIVNGQVIDVIYRRELNAATLAETETGQAVLRSYLDGKIKIEPPLNMLYDCKSPMAWVHHPETQMFFSEAVKKLIPPTVLLPLDNSRPFRLGEEYLTINEIFEKFSNDKRLFVVKYAGPSIEYGFGGRSVYSLSGTGKQARNIMEDARNQIRQGHPWIIQVQDRKKYPVWRLEEDRVIQEQMYARLLFYYCQGRLFAGHANFRKEWKVAGNKATVFSVICEPRSYVGGHW